MARTISTLPEELLLRVFDSLERLNDLYAIMLTCKQFNRISHDVKAETISRLALHSGSYFPALRPVSHFLLVASARRLAEWARAEEARKTRLKATMHGGVTGLVTLALDVAPITLEDVRDVWAWKRDTVIPLSKRFDAICGPASRREGESLLTVCEDSELALFSWAVYGELFDHILRMDWPESTAKLDSVTRFKFMIYCVPDVNSFRHMDLQLPQWFQDLRGRGESFQQLSLMHAMDEELSFSSFNAAIWQLMDLDVPRPTVDDSLHTVHARVIAKVQLFVQIIMNSGRKSLEVMRLAHMTRLGQQSGAEALMTWLWDLWALVEQELNWDPESSHVGTVPGMTYTSDHYLERNVPSMQSDLEFTLCGGPCYEFRRGATISRLECTSTLHKAIVS